MPDIRSDLGRKIRETAIEHFVNDTQAPTASFNRACGLRDKGGRTKVNTCFDNWVRLGVLTLQATGHGNGKSPHIFNWTGRKVEEVTLADAVRGYLEAGNVEDAAKSNARVALRYVFDLGTKCSDKEILGAAESIGALDIRTIPERVYQLALMGSFSKPKRTAAQYRSYLRALIRYGAENNLIPICLPCNWAGDPFSEAALKWFPRSEDRADDYPLNDTQCRQGRNGCTYYKDAICALYPSSAEDFADPADATPEMEREILDYLVRKGEVEKRTATSKVFGLLGSVFSKGPRAGQSEGMEQYYLRAPDGTRSSGLEGFRSVCEEHGMSSEWFETMEWLYAYETLSPADLRKRGMPKRRNRAVGQKTANKRITATRALLGVAVGRLGMDPATMTPSEVFGERYEEIVDTLMDVWKETHDGRYSGGLKDIIIGTGMLAYALYRKVGTEVAGREFKEIDAKKPARDQRKEARKIILEEEGMEKTAEERALHNAYQTSQARAAEIISELDSLSLTQDTLNTEKDVREIMERTPPRYWRAIQRHFLAQIEAGIADGDDSVSFHSLVLAAVIHGSILSTAFRQNEITHLRMGAGRHDHYDVEGQRGQPDRVISLFKWDRKNSKALRGKLREAYFPRWLEEVYLSRTRPRFIERGLVGNKSGVRLVERPGGHTATALVDPKSGKPFSDHPFFLVNTYGVPFGCPEEGAFGTDRNEDAHAMRINNMAKFWFRKAAKAAAEIGLEVPTEDYAFTLHDIRNVIGYEVKEKYGLEAAANLLGDSVSSIEKYYSAMDGIHIELDDDSIEGVGRERVDGEHNVTPIRPAQGAVVADWDAFDAECDKFDERLKKGRITPDEHAAFIASARAKYGLADAA